MSKYFWSDTHFSHRRILELCPETRKFKSTEEMDDEIIRRWNATIGDHDEIYFLGDFSFQKDPSEHFFKLKGKKHLVKGNHDHKNIFALPWASISDILTVRENGIEAICCHYPIDSWNKMHHGSLHFHGHQHGTGTFRPHRFDVGFDVWSMPVSFATLAAIAASQTFEPVDHHYKKGDI